MPEYKLPCSDCGSSDALVDYGDHTYCFSCSNYKNKNNKKEDKQDLTNIDYDSFPNNARSKSDIAEVTADLSDRGISLPTVKKYSVFKPDDPFYKAGYPLYKDGEHVANKYRLAGDKKGFGTDGETSKLQLFGQNLFPPGSAKAITVTEGYEDAMAAYELQGSRYPCVSIHSVSTARRDCANNFDYLNSFQEIILCFDKDEAKLRPDGTKFYPGQEAAQAVASIFPPKKVRILTLQKAKDANDYLKLGLRKEFTEEWWKAPVWTPQGIRLGKDLWDEIRERKNYETCDYPWDGLNALTYGIRLSEFVIITADTGIGKTSVLKEIEHYLLRHTDRSVGLLHLEEPNSDTGLGLMSIEANKPLHLPDIREEVTEEELKQYYDKTINSDRVIIYDHFGSNDIDDLLSKIRHMHALGAKYIVLDHLSIVVSDQSGDERKQLDEISTKLKTLCMELNIAVIAVIHQNRSGQIRGTAGVEQLANIVIKLIRDKENDDPWIRNITKVVVQKNRFCGRTGPATYLEYNQETGRLEELDKESVVKYEAGDQVDTSKMFSANKEPW